jgi:hypothetical protein
VFFGIPAKDCIHSQLMPEGLLVYWFVAAVDVAR